MEFTGRYELEADPDTVWRALFDPEVLREAIPGCESLEQSEEDSFAATVKLKIGPVSARFKGDVQIEDAKACKSCRITGKGSGGIAGFAKGSSLVELEPEGDGTILTYTADAAVGGKLAALGSRLIQSTSRKLADQFFTALAKRLETENEEPLQPT